MKILATSGGFRLDARRALTPNGLLRRVLELTGKDRPRLCLLATAGGDDSTGIGRFYSAFTGWSVEVSHLALFDMPNVDDPRAHLLQQDAVWVGGGSVANLLALWRLHGLDEVFREAWEAGVVLSGVSAGSLCWHVGGTTDSFGPDLRPVTNGLALLPYGNGVHYDSEEQRRPLLHRLVEDGTLPTSYATDDGVGLYYEGTDLVEAVGESGAAPCAAAYLVERSRDGRVVETRIEARALS